MKKKTIETEREERNVFLQDSYLFPKGHFTGEDYEKPLLFPVVKKKAGSKKSS